MKYVTLYGKDFADVITLRTLIWGDYLDSPGRHNVLRAFRRGTVRSDRDVKMEVEGEKVM